MILKKMYVIAGMQIVVICISIFILGNLAGAHVELYFVIAMICVIMISAARSCRQLTVRVKKELMVREQLEIIKCSVDKLQDAYLSRYKTDKAKDRFMSRMSHDLRTPLNAIMGYSSLMECSAQNPDKVRHYSRRIFVAGQSLLELVNDALDMSCIESGNLKLVEQEFRISAAIEEVKAAIRPQAEVKRLKFNTYITNDSSKDLIIGDKQRFCQIMRNLLSNAVKYTDEGGSVELIVNIIEIAPDEIQIVYQVKDTGCGMSEDFAKRLFEPFQREENEKNASIQGTGLGMCIAKSFAELMKGTISVESKQGIGTVVTVILPLNPVAADSTDSRYASYHGDALKGMRFLAAEDNDSNAEILKEVLSLMGAECTIAGNGQAVVEAFEKSEPGGYDAILMDIQMPVMNGYQAATQIRNGGHPDAERIVIIAMTADAFEVDVQRAFASGMNAHVAKPLNLDSFVETIKTLGLN